MLLCEGEQVMTMMAMQGSGTGIGTVLTSMILNPFLYVAVVASYAQLHSCHRKFTWLTYGFLMRKEVCL